MTNCGSGGSGSLAQPSLQSSSRREARRFEFTTEERLYGQALGKTANLGVISAVFFKERVSTITRDRSNARARGFAPGFCPESPRQR